MAAGEGARRTAGEAPALLSVSLACRLLSWGENSFDLLNVVEVVAGDHADNVLDTFLATLGMHAKVLPLIGSERFQQVKICFARDPMLREGFAWISFLVMPGGDPGVLVEGLDRGSGRAEYGSHAPADYDFYVGEVGEDFGGGPFARRGALTKLRCGDAFGQALKFFWSGGLDFEWILSLGVGQYALGVLLRGFGHLESPITLLRPSSGIFL